MPTPNLQKLMQEAISEAQKALEKKEVPIGAIIFDTEKNQIIGRGHNQKEQTQNPTTHAEIQAITQACQTKNSWRLPHTILISTCEPCPMCFGAIIQARIPHIVFGCPDPKFGAIGSICDLTNKPWNHQIKITKGILKSDCQTLLQDFFKTLRI